MNTSILLVSVILAQTATPSPPAVELPPSEHILDNLHARPRVMASADDFERVRRLIETDERAKQWYAAVKTRGEKMITDAPTAYEIPDGKRLLGQSRHTLDRALTLGLLYRIEGDNRYRDRLWQDMHAAAAFKDWNPSHFLDVGEMTTAFAVAYDWLYDAWTDEQRSTIRNAIIKHGVQVGLDAYRSKKPPWWTRATHNWNQVCNGGLSIGAIAIAEDAPELAGELLHHTLAKLPPAVEAFAPDGGCVEGPGYWAYATRYYVFLLSTLDAALGTDFGLSALPGAAHLGNFPVMLRSPTGKTFNFADGGDRTPVDSSLLWLAQRFNQPAWAHHQAELSGGTALDLLWYRPEPATAKTDALPLDARFRKVDAMVMRSAWNKPDAWYLACVAGNNRFNHGHLDLGSFVLDALGQRWAEDLGSDDYNMPGYFSGGAKGRRWTYYRMRAEGHNTLVIAPGKAADQSPTARATVTAFESQPRRAATCIDMTPAYAEHAERVTRRFELNRPAEDEPSVLIRDEIELPQPSDVYWFMHTRANVELDENGRRAKLTRGDATLYTHVTQPAGATFSVLDAAPLPSSPNPKEQKKNKGIHRLTIALKNTPSTKIEVTFSATPDAPSYDADTTGQQPQSAASDCDLIYTQDFENENANADIDANLAAFAFSDPTAWRITKTDGANSHSLELHTASQYKPPFRSPLGIAILKQPAVGSFALEADLMQTGHDYGHRDMCLLFGVRDASHYYYAHLATTADDTAHQIHTVDGADRRPITTSRSEGIDWSRDQWHHVRLECDIEAGNLRVFFDDMKTPVLAAANVHLTPGWIGFGSFDDTGRIDNIRLSGDRSKPVTFPGFQKDNAD